LDVVDVYNVREWMSLRVSEDETESELGPQGHFSGIVQP
jgi:hypothetical protein